MNPNDRDPGTRRPDGLGDPSMTAPRVIPGMNVRSRQDASASQQMPGAQQEGGTPYTWQTQPQGGWQQSGYPPQTQYQSGYPQQEQSWQAQQSWQTNPQGYQQAGWQQQGYHVPQQPWQEAPAAQTPPQNGKTGSMKKADWIRLAVILAVVAAVILVANLGGGKNNNRPGKVTAEAKAEVLAFDSKFCNNVYVDGIHLGGMTHEQAYAAVAENAAQKYTGWNIRLTYQGGLVRTISAADLGMTVNVVDALAKAWDQGHQSTDVAQRKAAMDALLAKPYYGYTAAPDGNTNALDSMLQQLAEQVYRPAQDAYVKEFNPQLSYPFVIEAEVYGRTLDVAPLKEQLLGMVENMTSGTVEIVPQEFRPNVTADDIRKNLVLRGRAYTPISTTSTTERTANIKRAMELISGTILEPGKNFSFNDIVGERSAKNGFYQAIEYAYGQERMGYGGGVCQASTTVYLAAVKANLEIVNREQHSDKVNYTDYGKDATVNLDGKKIDFKFRNNTDDNIYIVARVMFDSKLDRKHNVCMVEIYGKSLGDGVSYDLVTETVAILAPPEIPEYVPDKKGTYVTYIDEEKITRQASDGCVVDSYRVKYVNGEEVDRTYMYTDTYKSKAQQIYVGVKDR